jgi:AraC-like DNA-binding protein
MGKPYDLEELKIRLTNLLVMRDRLIHRFSDGKRLKTRSKEADLSPEDEFIELLQNLLEEHLDETEFGISEICKGMGISRTQLHNKLTALTGFSASRYIRKLRLAKAKELLDETELSVSEIGYATGFAQPSYFSNSFKAEYGISPSEYRSEE